MSIFDGMSCGRMALERARINVDKYYSSEVDKYAIQVADKNYPQDTINRLGDVCNIDTSKLPKIDLLIGGSPCQGFSMAGKLKGSSTKCGKDVTTLDHYLALKEMEFEFDGQSYLFWEYIRILTDLRKVNPDIKFMLENVRITKKWLPMFNKALGVEPIIINSSLLSAQNRVRFYWTNIEGISQPEDKGILLRDILEDSTHENAVKNTPRNMRHTRQLNQKSFCTTATMYKGAGNNGMTLVPIQRPREIKEFNENSLCHHVANATDITGNDSIKKVYAESGKSPTVTTMQGGHREPKVLCGAIRGRYNIDGKIEQQLEIRVDEKTNTLTTVQKDNVVVEKKLIESGCQVVRASVQKNAEHTFDGKVPTLTAAAGMGGGNVPLMTSLEVGVKYKGKYINTKERALYRKLTPLECERLQTMSDNCTLVVDSNGKQLVSNSQRLKMIGNGWTIDVISHIFSFIPLEYLL